MSESTTVKRVEAASDGTEIPVDDLEKEYGYSGGNLTTVTLEYNGVTYVKTYTYTAGDLTGRSLWVAQEA